jgi:hypothetical protein
MKYAMGKVIEAASEMSDLDKDKLTFKMMEAISTYQAEVINNPAALSLLLNGMLLVKKIQEGE